MKMFHQSTLLFSHTKKTIYSVDASIVVSNKLKNLWIWETNRAKIPKKISFQP